MELQIDVQPTSTVVSIVGEFDARTAPGVRDRLDQVVEAKPAHIVLDVTGLRLIDSTGVGGIVSLFKRARAYGGNFEVKGLNGQPRSIFEVLRLDRVFKLT